MTYAARPGTGGRKTRVHAGYLTQATRAIREQLGDGEMHAAGGAQMTIWRVDPDGDGVLCVRLSSEDVQKGETAFSQVHVLYELAERLELRARYLVVSVKLTGRTRFDRRPDFAFIRDKVQQERIAWVAWRDVDRVARDSIESGLFLRFLEESETRLYLAELGREVDWNADRLQLQVKNVVAEHERRRIVDRMQSGKRRIWLEEGRGYPTQTKFGFRRSADKYLEVDPEQWPFVERVCFDYATLVGDGKGSLSRMQEHLGKLGCPMSREKIRAILRDPMYVTGQWESTYLGETYACRPVDLPRPIPVEIYERNQALLATCRGKYTRVQYGTFLLNHIPVLHARCMDEKVKGRTPRLSALVSQKGAPPTYRHSPVPECCRRWTVSAAELDAAVVRELLRLAESPELQLEWAHAARAERGERLDALTASQRDVIATKIRNFRRQRQELQRAWLDRIAQGDEDGADPRYLQEGLALVDREIEALERQMRVADLIAADRIAEARDEGATPTPDPAGLLERMREVLTPTAPADPDLRQRRVAFVASVLSAVIVHDRPDRSGVDIELVGELMPANAPVVPVNPAVRGAAFLQGPANLEPSTNQSISGRFESDERVAAWRSPRVQVNVRGTRMLTADDLAHALRRMSDALPAGGMFTPRQAEHAEQLRRESPELPSRMGIQLALARLGLTVDAAVRSALGPEGLRKRRYQVRSLEDIRWTLVFAIEDGFVGGAGWWGRYEDFRTGHPYLLERSWLSERLHRYETTVETELVAARDKAQQRLGRAVGWYLVEPPRLTPERLVRVRRELEDVMGNADRSWVTPSEFALVCGVCEQSAHAWIGGGALPHRDGDWRNPWPRHQAPVKRLARNRRRIDLRRLQLGFVAERVDMDKLDAVLATPPTGWSRELVAAAQAETATP